VRKILFINHYAGSPAHGMEYRTFYFAREWVRTGHQVLVVAASFSHLRQRNPSPEGLLTREPVEGVDYLWVRTPAYDGNGVARVINMAAFVAGLYTVCRKAIDAFKPDVVIASSTYTWDNWPAAYYAKRHRARYVYELHDLWPLSPMELGGMSRWHPFIWSLQRAENFACRKADTVISLLPAAKDHLVEHGMLASRFVYVPNGIVPEEWAACQPAPAEHVLAIEAFRQGKTCLVGYVGGHGLSNALDVLIEAGADGRLQDVGIVCVGKGPEKERLEGKARALRSQVLFLGPVPKRSVPSLLQQFDVLFIGWARSPLYRFGISPNKLYEYMMAGVPILHAVQAANDPVREADCGLSVAPEDVQALCKGLLNLSGLDQQERRRKGANGKRYVEARHLISRLAEQFLESVLAGAERHPLLCEGTSMEDVANGAVDVRVAESGDLDGIVDVHAAAFPHYFLTNLGRGMLTRFYAAYLHHPNTVNVVATENGKVCAFIVGVCDADEVLKAFYRQNLGYVIGCVFVRLLTLNRVIIKGLALRLSHVGVACASVFSAKRSAEARPPAEGRTRLLSIAALPAVRGRGVSTKLMAYFEDRLRNRTVREVGLSVNSDNERAIAFYKKTGWRVAAQEAGTTEFVKRL
jgi:glycosyltransferase involved in cell wall biosynthesis/ribosomal protein S18 acetylase RimI-like enzyme